MNQHLDKETLEGLVQTSRMEDSSVEELFDLFRAEETMNKFSPEGDCEIDPRDGTLVLYNSARAKRPHDHASSAGEPEHSVEADENCPVCNGKTTGVIDSAELSEGYTFINKNLFPIIHPHEKIEPRHLRGTAFHDPMYMGRRAYGLHFLQWTSSYHHKDWHNMPLEDCLIALKRLAALEHKLLFESHNLMPSSNHFTSAKKTYGFVSIIKNFGKLVGGSLHHGHQQIAFSNVMPRRFYNDWFFYERRGQKFSEFLLKRNSPELKVRDYGEAELVVPYFMKRPYDMMLLMKDSSKQYLCELTPAELRSMAEGWRDAVWATLEILPQLGKDTAYNLTVNNGPGAGIYLEILPYTQETGGFERLGMWVCQNTPSNVAEALRATLAKRNHIEQPAPTAAGS